MAAPGTFPASVPTAPFRFDLGVFVFEDLAFGQHWGSGSGYMAAIVLPGVVIPLFHR